MDMRFVTWKIKRLYKVSSLISVTRELSQYRLDLVTVQEVRWEGSGAKPAGKYTFFYGKGNEINGDNMNNVRCEASRFFGKKEGISERQN
jgi:hypothetical protein